MRCIRFPASSFDTVTHADWPLTPLGDVRHVIYSCPGERIFIEDDEILSIIRTLQKSRAVSILQQLTANHRQISVKPWNIHTEQGCGGGCPGDGTGGVAVPQNRAPHWPTRATPSPAASCDIIPYQRALVAHLLHTEEHDSCLGELSYNGNDSLINCIAPWRRGSYAGARTTPETVSVTNHDA